jgi:C4-dicarboxylate-specific signal transduction histidine kinase
MQQLMLLEGFCLSGGLSFGIYSSQGQMKSILKLQRHI